jgi:hypothetical protein
METRAVKIQIFLKTMPSGAKYPTLIIIIKSFSSSGNEGDGRAPRFEAEPWVQEAPGLTDSQDDLNLRKEHLHKDMNR